MEGKTSLQVFFLLGLQVKEGKYVIFNAIFLYIFCHIQFNSHSLVLKWFPNAFFLNVLSTKKNSTLKY